MLDGNKSVLQLVSESLVPLVVLTFNCIVFNPGSVKHGLRNVVCCFLLQRSLFVPFLSKLIGSHTKTAIKARVICLGKKPGSFLSMKRLWNDCRFGEDLMRFFR